MSFEDDMIEYGFSDGNDYMDYLMDEADRMYEKNIIVVLKNMKHG